MTPKLKEMMAAARQKAKDEGRMTDAGTVCASRDRAAYIDHCEKHGADADVFEQLGRPGSH
jgi:hypothetical protein